MRKEYMDYKPNRFYLRAPRCCGKSETMKKFIENLDGEICIIGGDTMLVGSFILNMVIPCSNILMVKIATDGNVKVLYQGSSDTIENNVDLFNRYKISYLTAKGDKLLLYVKEC